MAKEFLDGPDVVTVLQEMGCKRVPNGVAWPRSHGNSTALRGFHTPKGPPYAFRSPYAEEFLEAAPESSPFPWLSPALGQAPAPHLRDLVDGWPKRRRWDGLPGRFRRLEPCFLRLENLG